MFDFDCDYNGPECSNDVKGVYLDNYDTPFALCEFCVKEFPHLERIDTDKNQLSRIRNLIEENAARVVDDFNSWGEFLQPREIDNSLFDVYDGYTPIGALSRLCAAKEAIMDKHYSKDKV